MQANIDFIILSPVESGLFALTIGKYKEYIK